MREVGEKKEFPPGRLIDVGSHRLHIYCVGQGSPTVILDAGLGRGVSTWHFVQHEGAKFTHVCAYDRAGVGWSDTGPLPRNSQRIVNELHTLLINAGVKGPYVLVGESFAGYNVRLYASQYPEDVVGLILVDATHVDHKTRLKSLLPGDFEKEAIRKANRNPDGLRIPEDFEESANQVRRSGPLPNIPLVVLTSGRGPELPEGFSRERYDQVRMEQQRDLAKLVPNSKHIIAENSGHIIQIDQPEVVINAIRQLVESNRHG